ncbi:phage tail assembly chaperone family protein, TAC [Spongiibacter tropicus]|uniref:phage tail assembly chaperone family protein, TAC n=1 Tax=Spongiibacter tropicus TaxID=454602 RepID=UPI00049009BA|nr:phage tail assembly chaperone family protein, TAC [Spongiibacter tropicus]
MDLTLDGLKKMGAFTGAPVKKEVEWKSGGESYSGTVYVRMLSFHSAKTDLLAAGGRVDQVAGRIAACICDAEGKSIFTPEDITGEADPARGPMDGNLAIALLGAIGEVNNLAGKPKATH